MKPFHLLFAFIATLLATAYAFAQSTQPDPNGGFVDAVSFLGSGPGILALTMGFVAAIKAGVKDIRVLNKIPYFVYVTVIATTLTILANKVFQTLDGDLMRLVWAALLNSLASSGAYSWLANGGLSASPEGASRNIRSLALITTLAGTVLAVGGCQQSPSQQFKIANETYMTAVSTVTTVSKLYPEAISLETMEEYNVARVAAKGMLIEFEMAVREGRPFNSQEALQNVLDDLAQIQLQAEKTRDRNLGSVRDRQRSTADWYASKQNHRNRHGGKARFDRCGAGRMSQAA